MSMSGPIKLHGSELAGTKLFFCGIGGCGMSALARLTSASGACCSGSDLSDSPVLQTLAGEGIAVHIGQDGDAISPELDLVIASAAVPVDNPELVAARRLGVPVCKYAELLGSLMRGRTSVAIAGTHGKSTTSSMLSFILTEAGSDPSFIIGASCAQLGGGARVGASDLLVAEACEYDRSFHNLYPKHSVILNVEEDHLDVYGTLGEIIEAFNHFAKLTDSGGSLLIGHDRAQRTAVTAGLDCTVETIGYNPAADWMIQTSRPLPHGQEVTLFDRWDPVCQFVCALPGEHMAYNAAVAAVTAHRLGVSWEVVAATVARFEGLDRRMQPVGEVEGVTVIDDYGHHPTEVDTTLRALRRHYRPEQQGGRLICVFQPHQHSRTRFLLEQFAASFSQADLVILPPIYFVRDSEADREAVQSPKLVTKLRQRGIDASYVESFAEIVAQLRHTWRPGDLVVVMGAGPVWQVAYELVGRSW